MRKSIFSLLAFALLASSCSLHDKLYIDLPVTTWEYVRGDVTTWVCFHDESNVSIVQYQTLKNLYQADYGTYKVDGHAVDLDLSSGSTYSLVRTFSNLKHSTTNKNFTKLPFHSFGSVAGSVWATAVDNAIRVNYFADDTRCVDLVYENLSRREGDYGWKATGYDYTLAGHRLDFGDNVGLLYHNIYDAGGYMVSQICEPSDEKETGSLKGTVWTYGNTTAPPDIPSVIIFNGAGEFTRISGAWTSVTDGVRISPYHIITAKGTYTVDGSTVTFTLNDEKESCSVSGSSFTLWDRTYVKVNY